MGEKLPFSNVEEYFLHKGFSKEEYDFLKKPKIRIGILSRNSVLEDVAHEYKTKKS